MGLRALGECADALAEGATLALIEPPSVDPCLHLERRLAVVVDLLDFDLDDGVVGRVGHRLLDDAGRSARGERGVPAGQDGERHARAPAQPQQRFPVPPGGS